MNNYILELMADSLIINCAVKSPITTITTEKSNSNKEKISTLIKDLTSKVYNILNNSSSHNKKTYKPEILSNLDETFNEHLQVDFNLFKNLKNEITIKTIKHSDTEYKFLFFAKPDIVYPAIENFIKFLFRLQIISTLSRSFEFLNINENVNG
jgi:preprotein translocase subunit SecA